MTAATKPKGPPVGLVRPQTIESMKRWPRDKVIQAMRDWKTANGRWPKSSDFNKAKIGGRWPTYNEVRRAGFASFADALKAAGCSTGVALPPKAATPAKYSCACGCGQSVNPLLETFETMVRQDRTHGQIAAELGYSREYISSLIRKPPRFVKGHNAYAFHAGIDVKQLRPDWLDTFDSFSLGRKAYLARCARRRHNLRLLAGELMFGSQAWREQRAALREAELAAALAASDELAALAAAQDKDSRNYRAPAWQVYIDANRFEDGYTSLHEIMPGHSPDPYQELVAQELHELVGYDLDGIDRLNSYTLERLQDKLRDEGYGPGLVMDYERERLRDPNRHSGASVAKMGSKHGGKRTRAQQQLVTREHHIRELPDAAKRRHAELRRYRRAELDYDWEAA